jgi:hypothetical protein
LTINHIHDSFPHGTISITIRSQLKLAGRVKKNSSLAKWWEQFLRTGEFEVPQIGSHVLEENYSRPVKGTEEEIINTFVEIGQKVLDALSNQLAAGGFGLDEKL